MNIKTSLLLLLISMPIVAMEEGDDPSSVVADGGHSEPRRFVADLLHLSTIISLQDIEEEQAKEQDYSPLLVTVLKANGREYLKSISAAAAQITEAPAHAHKVLEQVTEDLHIYFLAVEARNEVKRFERHKFVQFKDVFFNKLVILFNSKRQGDRLYDNNYFESRFKEDCENNGEQTSMLHKLFKAIPRNYVVANKEETEQQLIKMRKISSNLHQALYLEVVRLLGHENSAIEDFIRSVKEDIGFSTRRFYDLCDLIKKEYRAHNPTDVPEVAAATIKVFLQNEAFKEAFIKNSMKFFGAMQLFYLSNNKREMKIQKAVGDFKNTYFSANLEEVKSGKFDLKKLTESAISKQLFRSNIHRTFSLITFKESFVKLRKALMAIDDQFEIAGIIDKIDVLIEIMTNQAIRADSLLAEENM